MFLLKSLNTSQFYGTKFKTFDLLQNRISLYFPPTTKQQEITMKKLLMIEMGSLIVLNRYSKSIQTERHLLLTGLYLELAIIVIQLIVQSIVAIRPVENLKESEY